MFAGVKATTIDDFTYTFVGNLLQEISDMLTPRLLNFTRPEH